MLRALAHPLSLLVLAGSFVIGVTLHGWVQALVASRMGDRRPRSEARTQPDPRRHIDPFGALAALLSGLGWAKPVELLTGPRQRVAQVAVALSGPAVNLLLGLGALIAWRAAFGPVGTAEAGLPAAVADAVGAAVLLEQGCPLTQAGLSTALFLFACSQLYLGALSLVPLPPLDGGRLLFALAPRSVGWQRAEYQLVERNVGLVAVLVLLLIPLGGNVPLLPQLLDVVLHPLIAAVGRG